MEPDVGGDREAEMSDEEVSKDHAGSRGKGVRRWRGGMEPLGHWFKSDPSEEWPEDVPIMMALWFPMCNALAASVQGDTTGGLIGRLSREAED